MRIREAAQLIGTTVMNTNRLCNAGIRKRGPGAYLRAKKVKVKKGQLGYNPAGFIWDVPLSEVTRYKKLKVRGQGARGKKRKTT